MFWLKFVEWMGQYSLSLLHYTSLPKKVLRYPHPWVKYLNGYQMASNEFWMSCIMGFTRAAFQFDKDLFVKSVTRSYGISHISSLF